MTKTSHNGTDQYAALITYTGPHTAATTNDSGTISNLDGSIKDLCVGITVTNQTGTSPTATLKILGSHDGTVFSLLTSEQGGTAGTVGAAASPALDINTASTTNVSTTFSLSEFRKMGGVLPPFLRVRVVTGGSSTPGLTGVVSATVKR
jgi:hypothetical protein